LSEPLSFSLVVAKYFKLIVLYNFSSQINPNVFKENGAIGNDKPTSSTLNKKFKSFSGKPSSSSATSTAASLFFKPNNNNNNSLNDSSSAPIVRNEIPDIFWNSVEPYCTSITEDDIKLLESQLELNDKYLEFPKCN
jgi:hypothetical protein